LLINLCEVIHYIILLVLLTPANLSSLLDSGNLYILCSLLLQQFYLLY
jgi:hypothetical protein